MLQELIAQGGPVMYLLLACSVAAVAIILDRFWYWLNEPRRTNKRLVTQLISGTKDQKLSKAKASLSEKIMQLTGDEKGIRVANLLRKESERFYENATKHLSGLDTVVSIAPLLGILGTVLGIMKSFHALDLQHMTSPGAVGHGLAEAMITTAAGLAIAVPTLVFYNLFHSLAARHAAALFKLSEDVTDAAENTKRPEQ